MKTASATRTLWGRKTNSGGRAGLRDTGQTRARRGSVSARPRATRAAAWARRTWPTACAPCPSASPRPRGGPVCLRPFLLRRFGARPPSFLQAVRHSKKKKDRKKKNPLRTTPNLREWTSEAACERFFFVCVFVWVSFCLSLFHPFLSPSHSESALRESERVRS